MSKNLAKDISVLLHRAESDSFVLELTKHVAIDMEDLKEIGKRAAIPAGAGALAASLAAGLSPKGKRAKRAATAGGASARLAAAGQEGYKYAKSQGMDEKVRRIVEDHLRSIGLMEKDEAVDALPDKPLRKIGE